MCLRLTPILTEWTCARKTVTAHNLISPRLTGLRPGLEGRLGVQIGFFLWKLGANNESQVNTKHYFRECSHGPLGSYGNFCSRRGNRIVLRSSKVFEHWSARSFEIHCASGKSARRAFVGAVNASPKANRSRMEVLRTRTPSDRGSRRSRSCGP